MFQEAYSKKPFHHMTNIIKYIHQWQNAGIQKTNISSIAHVGKCPMCGELETQHHYFTCQDEHWKQLRNSAWRKLKQKLTLNHTHPHIISILSIISSSLSDYNFDNLEDTSGSDFANLLNQSISEQAAIGWKHMFCGRLSKSWTITQRYAFCHIIFRGNIPNNLQNYKKHGDPVS